ncbi:hypothetical protein WME89_20535 [Sorangium sp. So ce321]|uniref:hypothetical protein n=1 Tax=Sorangium sp. So ce321 TaxID=3133300 RepID=UPI003F5F1571
MSRRVSFPSVLTAAGLVALASCGGPTAATPPSRPAEAPSPAGSAPSTVPAPPRRVESLVDIVPRDAALAVSVPGADALLAGAAPAVREALLAEAAAVLAGQSGMSPELARDLAASFDGATVFVLGEAARGGAVGARAEHSCAAARFRDTAPVERLLKELPRETGEGGVFAIRGDKDSVVAHGAWLAESRVALLCARPEPLARALRVAERREPSFRTSALFQAERAQDPWLAADLHRLSGSGAAEPGSRLFMALPVRQGASALHVELAVYGPGYPALGTVLAATDHGAVAKLPAGALMTLGLSLQRPPGKTVSDVLGAFDGLAGGPAAAAAAGALAEIGLELGDLDRALGGEAAVGIYRDPKHKLTLAGGLAGGRRDEALRHSAVLIALATADEAAQKKVFGAVAAQMKRTSKKLRVKPGSLAQDLEDGNELRAEARRGFVLIGAGDRKYLAQVAARFGNEKESLAASPSFAEARADAKATSHLQMYIDRQALAGVLDGAAAASFGALGGSPTLLSLALAPSDRGLELTLTGHGGVEILGAGAALAVYGVRRYITSAKTAEAKNTVLAMARSAAGAFERAAGAAGTQKGGPPSRALCKSATPVPAAVPPGTRYTPSSSPGKDFNQGDDTSGWRCLRFSVEEPFYYQYDYRAGSGYKGPARGGPDPGKDGFEVSAEGDLDGDGETSLFTRTGKIINGKLVLSPQIFISNEQE